MHQHCQYALTDVHVSIAFVAAGKNELYLPGTAVYLVRCLWHTVIRTLFATLGLPLLWLLTGVPLSLVQTLVKLL